MFRRFLNRFKWNKLITPGHYAKDLARYRRQHPESLEKEREQIQRWIAHVDASPRAEQQDNKENPFYAEEATRAQALNQLQEIARAAFMSHPAASEFDFRRCWPSIREEMLKQHALEELAANPALSSGLARQASEASGTSNASQEPKSTNLQLLKRSGDSN